MAVRKKIKRGAMLEIREALRLKKNNIRAQRFWEYLDDKGRVDLNPKIQLGPYNQITNAWKNEPCIIVGSGPSLAGFDWSRLNKIHSIGINHVIEDYDKFEWFFFLDNRFLKRTTYDLKKFKGRVFAQNTCQTIPGIDMVKFKTIKMTPVNLTLDIKKGLYNGMLGGVAALHLALISGANPIFLIGLDCGGGTAENYHYKKSYTGALPTKQKWEKYKRTAAYFNHFEKWKKRIINLSPISNIKTFRKANINNFPVLKSEKKIQINRPFIVCHMIAMQDMTVMGDISRQVFERSDGKHIFCNINNPPPFADIYFLECFINQSKKFINFQRPYPKAKIISLIHSSSSCAPSRQSNQVIVLTNYWKKIYQKKGESLIVIPAAIDLKKYKEMDYNQKTFGRITRWSPGKVHPEWNIVIKNVLDKVKDSKCIMLSDKERYGNHPRLIVDNSIKIYEHEKKAEKLSQISIYADMHNTFVETFSLCLLEAMAAGMTIVLYSKAPQGSMIEVLNGNGFVCNNPVQFEKKIVELLNNIELKKEMGQKAKERAKFYSIKKMINSYNRLFREVLQ
jgi:glycosyltransferase involved in cell wall biosynthesis